MSKNTWIDEDRNYDKKTLVLCSECEGEGKVKCFRTGKWELEDCEDCRGTGRRVKFVKVWFEPFEEKGGQDEGK